MVYGVWLKMAALGCRIAERLLWEYIASLGESERAHRAYVEAIREGPPAAIPVMAKHMKAAATGVEEARRKFRHHSRDQGCGPEDPIAPLPSPPSNPEAPKRRKRRRR